MSTPKPATPAEIARETLKLLMTRRMAPSPDNYRAIYHEIAGSNDKATASFPEKELKSLVAALPRTNPGQQRLARGLEQALKGENWEEYKNTLVAFLQELGAESALGWGELIGELIRQWETKHANLTAARKRESFEHILSSASKNSEILFERLQRLVKSWSQNSAEVDAIELTESSVAADPLVPPPAGAMPVVRPALGSRASELLPELRAIFVLMLEKAILSQLEDQPELEQDTRAIIAAVPAANSLQAFGELQGAVKQLAYRLEFVAEDRAELRSSLLKLLQLTIDNVGELVSDDRWLNGQIAMVRDILTQPMSIRGVNEAEQRLKEVIFKQSQLKHSLTETQQALKQMLAGFVDHLAQLSDSTSEYHDKIEQYAEEISRADDITQLEGLLTEVIQATRTMQIDTQRSHDDLQVTRLRVDVAEKRINELQAELEKTSSLVRHDQLTGTLNRRGLEEAFESEFSRSRRRQSPLSVALLDIDNFKRLNDSLGHEAGDGALIHLASVIRETLRPQDTVARFGGEEFVILLPDTEIRNAEKALVRLQRELTRRIFMHDNEKILITFSAGVTDLRPDDNQGTVTKRADEAMYTAKKSGKNRVVIA